MLKGASRVQIPPSPCGEGTWPCGRPRGRIERRALRRRPAPARSGRRDRRRGAGARGRGVLVLRLRPDQDPASLRRRRRGRAHRSRAPPRPSPAPRRRACVLVARPSHRRPRRLVACGLDRRAGSRARSWRGARRAPGRRRRRRARDRVRESRRRDGLVAGSAACRRLERRRLTGRTARQSGRTPCRRALVVLGGGPVGVELAQFFHRWARG